MFRLTYHGRPEELGGALHYGIYFRQVSGVGVVQVMLPEVGAEPCAAGIGGAPGGMLPGIGVAPGIRHHVHHPSTRGRAIEHARRMLAGADSPPHQVDEWSVQLSQIARLGQPMVHLHVDVGVIVAVPGRGDAVGPQPLQVGRQAAR